jgi:hypothetical protein
LNQLKKKQQILINHAFALSIIKSINKIKNMFIEEQKNKDNIFLFQLWEKLADLQDYIQKDIFGKPSDASRMFNSIFNYKDL